MQQIQLVGLTPAENNQPIFDYIDKKFKELQKSFQPKEPVEYLTRQETADLLKVDLSTLFNWKRNNTLLPLRIGKRVLYTRKSIEDALVTLNR